MTRDDDHATRLAGMAMAGELFGSLSGLYNGATWCDETTLEEVN